MKKQHIAGVAAAFTSAFLFGLAPILAKLSYAGGNNSITLSFWRSAFAIPLFVLILIVRKTSLKLTKREVKEITLTGIGTGTTPLLLYSSYNYIAGGVATSLHFLFPIIIMAVGIIFLKEKATLMRVLAAICGFIGIALLSGLESGQSAIGIVLALVSAFSYALYMILVQRSSLKDMDYFKLGFYLSIVNTVIAGVYALCTNSFVWSMTTNAWMYNFILAILLSIVAVVLLNYSIIQIGAASAAMLSVLEPITGVVLSVLIFSEQLNNLKITGFIAVALSVFLVSASDLKKEKVV